MKPYSVQQLTTGDYVIEVYSENFPFVQRNIFRGTRGDWYSGGTGQVVHPSWTKYLDGILKLEEWKEIDQSNPT